nr:unnamed protein product [Callosobruchus analis]
MNRKHVKSDMDSGLGSDEDRRGRSTKEQKQLRNQQLLSGCFIDAANLSDDAEVDQRRSDERRQGALLFQTSVPHFSMLQMSNSQEEASNFSGSSDNLSQFPETNTPYNSIVHLDNEEPDAARKSPLGFYVDLSDVPDTPKSQPSSSATKNIFSMVIDFEGPKKEKPMKLTSSYAVHKKAKLANKSSLTTKANGSLSSSVSSVNSISMAGTSRQSEEHDPKLSKGISCEVLSVSLIKKLSISSKSSSSTENFEKMSETSAKDSVDEEHIECDNAEKMEENLEGTNREEVFVENKSRDNNKADEGSKECNNNLQNQERTEMPVKVEPAAASPHQFVRLSDLECQKPARVDLNFTPRMSRSIPESSWVESPLLMSNSVGYRSAPHPLEPELTTSRGSDTLSHSFESSTSSSQPKKMVRRLGTDLLRMFLEEIGPDVTVEVEGHKMKAHKCILASRCQYFAALVSGNWLEKSGNVISLQGFSYESVYFALCHIYSGAAHVPDSISLVELASLADMLGLEGLKEVVEHALKLRHCHNFHRPCAGCCTGVLEVLPLSAAYGLDELYQRCLHWVTQHFVRVWPSRAFASLPRELREKCYQQHVVHMTPDKVLETIVQCEKVLSTLPAMRWSEPVSQLVVQLTDACHLYHRQHFAAVLGSRYVAGLDAGLGFGVAQVEDQMLAAAKNLGVEQACKSYTRCSKMLNQSWSRPFGDMLNKIKSQLEQCLVSQADRLIRSNAWLRLDTALRSRIKELTPALEPASRLPRATHLRHKKPSASSAAKSGTSATLNVSSSDSSRNSSPITQQQQQHAVVGGAGRSNGNTTSLRRSLLLAAKAPQQQDALGATTKPPPQHKRTNSGGGGISTLTQPTAASAAKSAAARVAREARQRQAAAQAPQRLLGRTQPHSLHLQRTSNTTRQSYSSRATSGLSTTITSGVSRNSSTTSVGKSREPIRAAGAPKMGAGRCPGGGGGGGSRSSSPMKSDTSRTSSPRKLQENSSGKSSGSRVSSPVKTATTSKDASAPAPAPARRNVKNVASAASVGSTTTTSLRKTAANAPSAMSRKEEVHVQETKSPAVLQRSSTFLKDEPTVLGKII